MTSLLAAGAVLIAAVGYASGPMILKRHLVDLDPRATMGAALMLGAVALTPLAILDAPSKMPDRGRRSGSVVVLGLVCTAMAFVLMAMLIAEVGPSRAVVITYVNPIVAVALGVALLGERPGAGGIAGLLLILAGSWLSTDGRLPPGVGAGLARVRRSPATPAGRSAGQPVSRSRSPGPSRRRRPRDGRRRSRSVRARPGRPRTRGRRPARRAPGPTGEGP